MYIPYLAHIKRDVDAIYMGIAGGFAGANPPRAIQRYRAQSRRAWQHGQHR
jgi:hypothetical protein